MKILPERAIRRLTLNLVTIKKRFADKDFIIRNTSNLNYQIMKNHERKFMKMRKIHQERIWHLVSQFIDEINTIW